MPLRLLTVEALPLEVPLVEPFVIASARVDVTPNVLVRVVVEQDGRRATGLGEAATLSPVTHETPALVNAALRAFDAPRDFSDLAEFQRYLTLDPVARAGLETAVTDALAQLAGVPVRRFLGGGEVDEITSNMTLPIGEPAHMADLAARWWRRGFRVFKVKIGRDLDDDLRALSLVSAAVPGARFRLDANAGFTSEQALFVAAEVLRLGLDVECFEQPCARDDLEGLARVTREVPFDVVADESLRSPEDLDRLLSANAVDGINLKLVKLGGYAPALEIGRRAQAAGLSLMVGSMVETRLGVAAAAQLAATLGGVAFPDLDTAWLLASDPFDGDDAGGPVHRLSEAPGVGVTLATRR